MKIWTDRQVILLAGRCIEASLKIEDLLDHRKVDVEGANAWGQYLDAEHHSQTQWGFFGTSAAVQVLVSEPLSAAAGDPRIQLALQLLPESTEDPDPRIQPKIDRGHLKDIIRLAAIAESLRPSEPQVSPMLRPKIVGTILECAHGQAFWHPAMAAAGNAPTKGDPVATAFIVHALRRYEDPAGVGFRDQRSWLADELLKRSQVRARPHAVALIGLALQPLSKDPNPPANVNKALEKCRLTLLDWRRQERGLVVNRPIFHGYQLDGQTEYVLLNPELLAALFFLRLGNPYKARSFTLSVAAAVTMNVETHEGFEGQPGATPTVDQMWAVKLLRTLSEMNEDPGRKALLRPRLASVIQVHWWTVIAIIVVLTLVVGLTSQWGLGVIAAFLASSVVNVVVALVRAENG